MYYVTYLSKPRTRFGISEEEMKAEYERNFDKRVTKVTATIRSFDNYYKVSDALTEVFNKVCNAYHLPPWQINLDMTDFSDKYETFHIPKASGGVREITAPLPELRNAQREALKIITKQCKFLPHNAAHGFTKNRNPKTALQVHQANKSKWFLKMDIKDFFPSCTSTALRNTLSKVYPFYQLDNIHRIALVALATKNGRLPQGSPLSPLLANMIMVPVDIILTQYCKENKLIYTRYADDIMISSREHFNPGRVIIEVQTILEQHGFQLNQDKSRYGSSAGRNWNLGLMYNEAGDITVGHQKKKLVKNMVHNFTTKPEEQTQANKYKLLGIVGYCAYIEPDYFKPYLNRIQQVEI
jgi:retron-type reverse transcriptase